MVQYILWIFVVLLFYRSGGIVGSVTGCCVPSLLTNGGALCVFDIRSLGESDCDTEDYLVFTDVRERLSVIKRVTLGFIYENSNNFRNKGTEAECLKAKLLHLRNKPKNQNGRDLYRNISEVTCFRMNVIFCMQTVTAF